MTGSEHYDEAEKLLQSVRAMTQDAMLGVREATVAAAMAQLTAEAQVHATLALAQATLVAMESADWERAR